MILTLFFSLVTADIASPDPSIVFRQPQLAVNGRELGLAFGAGDRVYFSGSRDEGKSWSQPVELPAKGKLSLGMRRGPRIAISGGQVVISAILGEKGRGADGDLVAWSSADGGKTWSEGRPINTVAGSAREGLHAMAAGGGLIFAAWLDLREKGTRVFGSVSRDGGQTWSPDRAVYTSPSGSVCECCHPSVLVDARGKVSVMFRNAVDGSRDMYLVESTDAGRSFGPAKKLGVDTWKLNACPMDGGALVSGPRGVITVWRRESDIFLSEAQGPEKRLGTGRQPVIVSRGANAVVAWTEGKAVRWWRSDGEAVHSLDGEAAFLSLISLPGNRLLLAGERQGRIFVDRLN